MLTNQIRTLRFHHGEMSQAELGQQVGLTRQEIRDLFSRNKSAKAINSGLAALERAGRMRREERSAPSGRGRPAEVWVPVSNAS